jgi:hypothetical protein
MACNSWEEGWIAHLYDELEPDEAARVEKHLVRCSECRATMDELGGARRILRDASPAVPPAPRVVVMQPPRLRHPAWAFAAGVASAGLLFVAALFAAGRTATPQDSAGADLDVTTVSREEMQEMIETAGEEVRQRLDAMESEPRGTEAESALLTRADLEGALDDFRRSTDARQKRWIEFVLEEIDAAERRTGNEIHMNREALRFALLASNPGLSEQ